MCRSASWGRACWAAVVLVLIVLSAPSPAAGQTGEGPPGREQNMGVLTLSWEDQLGNQVLHRKGRDQRTIGVVHRSVVAGEWEERYRLDRGGSRVAEIVDATSEDGARFLRALELLGAESDRLPDAERSWGNGSSRIGNGLFEVVESSTALDGRRQTTRVGTTNATVESIPLVNGWLIWDDLGGLRREVHTEKGLTRAFDELGLIVAVDRDSRGRLSTVDLGGTARLVFEYGDGTPQWIDKRIVDLRTGETIFRWESALRAGEAVARPTVVSSPPRPSARAFLPGYGAVAEWDSTLYPKGVVAAGLGGIPAVLVDLESGEPVARSLTIFEPETARGWDRVDYTDQAIFLHLVTDASGPDAAERTVIVTVPRKTNRTRLGWRSEEKSDSAWSS